MTADYVRNKDEWNETTTKKNWWHNWH